MSISPGGAAFPAASGMGRKPGTWPEDIGADAADDAVDRHRGWRPSPGWQTTATKGDGRRWRPATHSAAMRVTHSAEVAPLAGHPGWSR